MSGEVDVNKVLPGLSNKSVFATAILTSEAARPARLAVGSDDTLHVWLNGKEVYKFNDHRSFSAEESSFDVDLTKGENRLLVRCGNFPARGSSPSRRRRGRCPPSSPV